MRLSGRIDEAELRIKLDQDYKIGGAGLNSKTAERLGSVVEDFIQKAKIVVDGKGNKNFDKTGSPVNPSDFNGVWGKITELRKDFIEPFHMALSDRQIARIETAIYNRIIGDFDKRKFNEMLDRFFSQGGVGLNKATAKKIARELEVIMLLTYGAEK